MLGLSGLIRTVAEVVNPSQGRSAGSHNHHIALLQQNVLSELVHSLWQQSHFHTTGSELSARYIQHQPHTSARNVCKLFSY